MECFSMLKPKGHGLKYFKHGKKRISALGYSTQKNYYLKLMEE
jgi:hypothetical protein